MADIVLKNQSGNPVAYEGVTKLHLTNSDGGTEVFEPLLNFSKLNFYYSRAVEENGKTKYEIMYEHAFGKLGSGPKAVFFPVDDTACVEYGALSENGKAYIMQLICSRNVLTIGNKYTLTEISGSV